MQCEYKQPNVVLICLTLCFSCIIIQGSTELETYGESQRKIAFKKNLISLGIESLSVCFCETET